VHPELFRTALVSPAANKPTWERSMNSIIYIVGLVVVVIAVLSLLGLS
jgi:hypothetical protein